MCLWQHVQDCRNATVRGEPRSGAECAAVRATAADGHTGGTIHRQVLPHGGPLTKGDRKRRAQKVSAPPKCCLLSGRRVAVHTPFASVLEVVRLGSLSAIKAVGKEMTRIAEPRSHTGRRAFREYRILNRALRSFLKVFVKGTSAVPGFIAVMTAHRCTPSAAQ